MNDILKLKNLANEITNTDRIKFDRIYNEILYPMMEDRAKRLKLNELSIRDNNSNPPMGRLLAEIIGNNSSLQWLVEHEMKPYLEEKGFKVAIYSPNYYVYIRW